MPLSADIVARVSRRLAEHAGLELPAWVVEARTIARIEELGCDPHEYVELIGAARGHAELVMLLETVRVGESSLFRHRQQITTLVEVVVPELRAKRKRSITVWSAGCSGGQEPYTLAAVLSHALPDARISIVATDVSSEALDEARGNRYAGETLEDVPSEYREMFVVEDGALRVVPEIQRLVRFEKKNLIERGMGRDQKFDLVWCRNVLIYFTPDARRRAIDHLIEATAPDGYIFVGYSESLRDIAELRAVRTGDVVYYGHRERASSSAKITAPRPIMHTPVPVLVKPAPPTDDAIVLKGKLDAAALTQELAARLAQHHARVVIDLDGIDALDTSVVPVLRRATAAARAAGGELVLRARRASTKSFLERAGFEVDE